MKPVKINYAKVLGFENYEFTIECELQYGEFNRIFWAKTNNKIGIDNALSLEDNKQAKVLYFLIKDEIVAKVVAWQENLDNQD